MADLEIRDVSGNVLVTLTRAFSYPWPRVYQTNVAVGLTIGGKARGSRRGTSRLVNRLTFRQMGQQQAAEFLAFLRDHAGGAKPFLLHFGGTWETKADGTKNADGSAMASGDFRCRYYGPAPAVSETFFRHHEITVEFEQDLI